jgi:uncharacterized protein
MKYLFLILIILVGLYLTAGVFLSLFQRKFLYFPQKGVGAVGEKEIKIKNGDTVLTGWIINEGKDNAILYYGGNAERIEYNIPLFEQIFSDYTVYLISYRGYGMSDGSPTETNLCNDAVYIYDVIKDQHNKISLIGRSIGSGVATYVASERPVDKLVLITPFDSIEKVAQGIFWMFPMSCSVEG